jgi:hypothetical protein
MKYLKLLFLAITKADLVFCPFSCHCIFFLTYIQVPLKGNKKMMLYLHNDNLWNTGANQWLPLFPSEPFDLA